MFKYIAMIFLIAISPLSLSLEVNEWTLDVNAVSKHKSPTYDGGKKYNEDNLGFGITYGYKEKIDVTLGYYENSYFKTSFYGGIILNKDYYIRREFAITPGLGILMVSGYDDTPMNKSALAAAIHPGVSFGFRNFRSNIGVIPTENMVLTFQAQFKF